ncbi:hypothetical protein [Salinigranum marinum]|uniref:hypothetical protein n=1 Tax=Salinigranum marinum TaxID=1515595 RepID=UPI002989ECC3|nr:hypothetical protein [Salinigranum marinum]
MFPADPSHESNRSRRAAAAERAPAAAFSLAFATLPVVVVGVLSHPTVSVAAAAGVVVTTAAHDAVERLR